MARILIVDDEIGIRELLSEILQDEGHDVILAENAAAARDARDGGRPDLVLLDIWMPDSDGISLLKEWSVNGKLTMPVIMMSGHGTIDSAVEATRIGAMDFLEKPIALQKLLSAVKRGLVRADVNVAPQPLTLAAFSRSAPLRDLRRRLEQICERSRAVLLRQGSGSITELAARSVGFPTEKWIEIEELAETLNTEQLQAIRDSLIFIPELAKLSRAHQRNLAFLMDRLERLRVRVVAVTEYAPERLLTDGWDEGVIERLFEVAITLPSMPELADDIPEIATQVLQHLSACGEVGQRRFASGALNALRTHPWPGGYSELCSAIKSVALYALNEVIEQDDVRAQFARDVTNDKGINGSSNFGFDLPLREAREQFERAYFEYHMVREGGNMTRLAEKTGVERTHLYRKLKQLGLPTGRRAK